MEYCLLKNFDAYFSNANLKFSIPRNISPHKDSTGQMSVLSFCPVQDFSNQNRYSYVTDKQTSIRYGIHLSIHKQGKDQ